MIRYATIKPSFRAKALALAMLAVAPWPGLWIVGRAASSSAFAVLCATLSLVSFVLLARLLRPFERISRDLAALAVADGADAGAFERADASGQLALAAAHLSQRFHSFQHRWMWRHPLTGLAVRETLIRAIADDLGHSGRATLLGAIRFVDFNRLTAFDPAAADAMLQVFSERLAGSLGKARPVAQVDRGCFAIWFQGADPDAAVIELKAVCYALGAEIAAGDLTVVPELEVGTAHYPADGQDPGVLINHALVSLARPGASGGVVGTPGRSAEIARERFSLEQDLRRAIDRDQFEMVFQPVVDLSKGVVGAEALLRWRHPEAGMISPSRFIPMLEDTDLIDDIGKWTLNTACRELRTWQQRGLTDLKVAVNLSAAQLRDPHLRQTIERTLARHQIRAQALELELTETAAMQDAEHTFALFRDLRALGLTLAIDDFGSGYSSLSYLKNLPFDKLKIDREFVVDIHLRRNSQAICRSLIALTRGLELDILAEGVESWDEVDILHRFGCRTFQGFLFSEPLDSDHFLDLALDPQWRKPVGRPTADPLGTEEKRKSA